MSGVRDWASPHVLVAALLVIAAAAYYLASAPPRVGPAPEVSAAEPAAPPTESREVELHLADADGEVASETVTVNVRDDRGAAWEALVAALRERLVEAEVWPEALPAPRVFALEIDGRPTAVVDVVGAEEVAMDVADEERVLRSLRETLGAAGAARIAVLRNGAAVPTPLGHVGAPADLSRP